MNHAHAVVTGLGIITALGCDVPSFWKNLLEGVCGIGDVTLFDASRYRSHKAAEVKDFIPTRDDSRRQRKRMSS